jgi:hypothetical protein
MIINYAVSTTGSYIASDEMKRMYDGLYATTEEVIVAYCKALSRHL